MTLEEAKIELEKFVKLKTTMRPAFLDVILKAEPVRHGKWNDDTDEDNYYANCSVCGYQMDVHHEHGYFNYCPNCGCQMDEVGG